MLSRTEVVAAFRAVLGREPENEQAVALHRTCPDVATLGRILRDSDEFATLLARRRLTEGRGKLWVRTERADGITFWADLHDPGVSAGVLRGAWRPAETAFMLSLVKPGDVVLDLSAGLGWFAVLLAQAVGPSGRVHAFEPRADIFPWLARNVAENGLTDRCTLHPLAPDWLGLAGPIRLARLDAEPDLPSGAIDVLRRDRPVVVAGTEPAALMRTLAGSGYTAHPVTDHGVGAELRFPPSDFGSEYAYHSVAFLAEADRAALLDGRQDGRVRDLEARLAAAPPPAAGPEPETPEPDTGAEMSLLADELDAATRRAEAAELRCADLAAQLLHRPAGRDASPGPARALRAELDAMRASTSWRLTAPLRAVAERLRR